MTMLGPVRALERPSFVAPRLGRALTHDEQDVLAEFFGYVPPPPRVAKAIEGSEGRGEGGEAGDTEGGEDGLREMGADVIVAAIEGWVSVVDGTGPNPEPQPAVWGTARGLRKKGQPVSNVRITGELNLEHVHFERSLYFHSCEFEGSVSFARASLGSLTLHHCELPTIILINAVLRGNLEFVDCVITDDSSIEAMGLNVNGYVLISHQTSGALNFDFCRVGGFLQFEHVTSKAPMYLWALQMSSANISGNVRILNFFASASNQSADGINLSWATIRGELSFERCDVSGVFEFSDVSVGRFVKIADVREGRGPAENSGFFRKLVLSNADVQDYVQIVNCELNELLLDKMSISGTLETKKVSNRLTDLRYTKASAFSDDIDSWPSEVIFLDGFVYNDLVDSIEHSTVITSDKDSSRDWVERYHKTERVDKVSSEDNQETANKQNSGTEENRRKTDPELFTYKRRIEWLNRMQDHAKGKELRPQPFLQLARALRRLGHEYTSDMILFELAKRRTEKVDWTWQTVPQKIWHVLLRVTCRHGYQPLRAVFYIFLLWVLGAFIFGLTAQYGYMRPSPDKVLESKSDAAAAGRVSFNDVFASRDRQVRVTDVPQLASESGPVAPVRGAEPGAQRPAADAGEDVRDIARGDVPAHYVAFDPWVYSLDVMLPVIDLHQESFWLPFGPDTPDIATPDRVINGPGAHDLFIAIGEGIAGFFAGIVPLPDNSGSMLVEATIGHEAAARITQGVDAASQSANAGLKSLFDLGFGRVWMWFQIIAGWALTAIAIAGFTGVIQRRNETL